MDPDCDFVRPDRVFVGRRAQLAALSGALRAVRGGEPRVVLIQGQPGIGKSSLIAAFLASNPGLPAVTASGDEAEALLPYGLVQQLATGAAALLPDALASLGLLASGTPAVADPLAVGVELLALISSLQGADGVTLVVEDLQWSDLQSARALLFACRRLAADRVLVILSCRPGGTALLGESWDRFLDGDRRAARLALSGLDTHELGLLCQELGHARVPQRSRHELAARLRGERTDGPRGRLLGKTW